MSINLHVHIAVFTLSKMNIPLTPHQIVKLKFQVVKLNSTFKFDIYDPLDYSIWNCISNRISYEKVETSNDLRRKIQKSIKKFDVNYVRDTIDVYLCRVRSVEKHNGELIFDEHS